MIQETKAFKIWFDKLDCNIKLKISIYLDRLSQGNTSNSKPLRDGIYELKINYQKGWRIYYIVMRDRIIFLLWGGNKSGQDKDLKKAIGIKNALNEGGKNEKEKH
jgi:putative addiction module killer protein